MILDPGYPLKDVEAKLDRTNLAKGTTAVLTLHAGKEAVGGQYFNRRSPPTKSSPSM